MYRPHSQLVCWSPYSGLPLLILTSSASLSIYIFLSICLSISPSLSICLSYLPCLFLSLHQPLCLSLSLPQYMIISTDHYQSRNRTLDRKERERERRLPKPQEEECAYNSILVLVISGPTGPLGQTTPFRSITLTGSEDLSRLMEKVMASPAAADDHDDTIRLNPCNHVNFHV